MDIKEKRRKIIQEIYSTSIMKKAGLKKKLGDNTTLPFKLKKLIDSEEKIYTQLIENILFNAENEQMAVDSKKIQIMCEKSLGLDWKEIRDYLNNI